MARDFSQAVITGRLGGDPEARNQGFALWVGF